VDVVGGGRTSHCNRAQRLNVVFRDGFGPGAFKKLGNPGGYGGSVSLSDELVKNLLYLADIPYISSRSRMGCPGFSLGGGETERTAR
jgi:hypothetical protein